MNDTTFQSNSKVTYVPVVVNAEPHKQTNADRLRAMTDEELAQWIRDQIIDRNIGIPSEAWLDWLKQEASGEQCNTKEA
jgi:hypothetical protein